LFEVSIGDPGARCREEQSVLGSPISLLITPNAYITRNPAESHTFPLLPEALEFQDYIYN
jgi:hypothetical protein